MIILYIISTFLLFFIKILNSVQTFILEGNDFFKRINNWNSYLFTGIIVIYFTILFVLKKMKKIKIIKKLMLNFMKTEKKIKNLFLIF